MSALLTTLAAAALEVVEATVPVLILILVFQLVVLRRRPEGLGTMLLGTLMAMVGFTLFVFGAKVSLIPMGLAIGEFLAGARPIVVVVFSFALGLAVAAAEPAVRVFAFEVDEVSAGSVHKRWIVATIALGVGVALVLAVLRIESTWTLAWVLVPSYALVLLLTLRAPRSFVPLAYDAGAVATGPVAVNFVVPLTTGLALGLWGHDAGVLGFGVVALIAIFPILGMLVLGFVLGRGRFDA